MKAVSLIQLGRHAVRKPWGRTDVPAEFLDGARAGPEPVGEIWFDDPTDPDPALLIKYLFTSERLSIQVHPDDDAARASGYPRGKSEAWFVLSAEAGAAIALGPRQPTSAAELHAAALDGSIEGLVYWRPVQAGEFIYSPAGTVHAIGAGLRLIEIQQNLDLTYRLYDYGRPRELHLKQAIAASTLVPFEQRQSPHGRDDRELLAGGAAFVVERWCRRFSGRVTAESEFPLLLIPLAPGGEADGAALSPGSVWKLTGEADLHLGEGADLLVAYAGSEVRSGLRS